MWGHSHEGTRTLRVAGNRATLRGHMEKNEIAIHDYCQGQAQNLEIASLPGEHAGGDLRMMDHFCDLIRSDSCAAALMSAEISLESHLISFAAEKSRLNHGAVVDMAEYRDELETRLVEPMPLTINATASNLTSGVVS